MEKVIKFLRLRFGDQRAGTDEERFYTLKQAGGESVMDFSHKLHALFVGMQKDRRTAKEEMHPERILPQRFLAGLREDLKTRLRDFMRDHPTAFLDIWERNLD